MATDREGRRLDNAAVQRASTAARSWHTRGLTCTGCRRYARRRIQEL